MATNLIVVYTGGAETFDSSSKWELLTKGARYTVTNVRHDEFHVYYTLDGIDGEFNTAWFKQVKSYLAIGRTEPKVGEELVNFYRYIANKEEPWQAAKRSSVIIKVTEENNGIYVVDTLHSTYHYFLKK